MSQQSAADIVPPTDASTNRAGAPAGSVLPFLWGFAALFRHHGHTVSANALRAAIPELDSTGQLTAPLLKKIADENGFIAQFESRALRDIPSMALPVLLQLKDGQVCVLQSYNENQCRIQLQEFGEKPLSIATAQLISFFTGEVWFVRPNAHLQDHKLSTYQGDRDDWMVANQGWFWRVIWRFRATYFESAVAALLINVLALAGSIFSMNVYDRVIPNNAVNTLWVMAIGVCIVYVIELGLRTLRGYFLDSAAKKADLILSSNLFRQTLNLRLEQKPGSAGNFAGQLREFESVRDFCTSATLVAIVDLPFIFLFVWVIYLIAGPLAWGVLIAIPAILLVGGLIQFPLATQAKGHHKINASKYGVLVESIDGMESLKAMGAERFMRLRWDIANAHTAQSGMVMRVLSAFAVNFTQSVQQLVNVILIVWGAYLVSAGELTTGAMIAATILSGRALAPLSQVAGLFARFQQALVSYRALDKIMQMTPEREVKRSYLHKKSLQQSLSAQDLKFGYNKDVGVIVDIPNLRIEAGERVAILGRIGSGKTTLLKLLATLYTPQMGAIMLDDIDAQQIDPADRRALVGYVGQEISLFRGTLRENLLLGNPFISDEEIVNICALLGLDKMAAAHPKGFDMPIGEHGVGLSGGQKQMIALARMLVLNPAIILLDEPTSSLDQRTEQFVLQQIKQIIPGKTLIVVTHKPAMLDLVERLVVMDHGKIVIDGPKDSVLTELQRGVSVNKSTPTKRGVA